MEQSPQPTIDIEVKNHKSSSRRQFLTAMLVGVGLVSAGAIYAGYASAHTRYWVQGVVQPDCAYRIEYTISTRYRKIAANEESTQYDKASTVAFVPAPPSRLVRLFSEHLPTAMKHVGGNFFSRTAPGTIKQYYFQSSEEASIVIGRNGYPDCSGLGRFFTDFSQSYMRIGGCNATYCEAKGKGTGNPHFVLLILKTPEHDDMYAFSGMESLDAPAIISNEINRIANSIKLTKVR